MNGLVFEKCNFMKQFLIASINSYLKFLSHSSYQFLILLLSELGNSYMASVKTASHNERNPRALICILMLYHNKIQSFISD
jgi:hypothetical protein